MSHWVLTADDLVVHDSWLTAEPGRQAFAGRAELELNTHQKLTMSLTPANPAYRQIIPLKTRITLKRGDKAVFDGRARVTGLNIFGDETITCEGDAARLLDGIQAPWQWNGDVPDFLAWILARHNAQLPAGERWLMGNVTVTDPNQYIVRSSTEWLTTWEVVNTRLIDSSLGGYLVARRDAQDRLVLDYLDVPGPTSSQVLDFGSNLVDLATVADSTDLVTRLYPLGAQLEEEEPDDEAEPVTPPPGGSDLDSNRVTIADVNGGVPYLQDDPAAAMLGVHSGVETWDDVHVPEILVQRGAAFLAEHKFAKLSLDLAAVDLHDLDVDVEALSLGDRCQVRHDGIGLDEALPIRQMTIDITDPSQTSIKAGGERRTLLSQSIQAAAAAADQVVTAATSGVKGQIAAQQRAITDVLQKVGSMSSSIEQTPAVILAQVAAAYQTLADAATSRDEFTAQLALVAQGLYLQLTQMQETTQASMDGVVTSLQSITELIWADVQGIHVGRVGDPVSVLLSNGRLVFTLNGVEIAWFDGANQRLYIRDAVIGNSLTIGAIKIIPEASGGVSGVAA